MIVSVSFNSLVTFDCVYGDLLTSNASVRVFVEKGLIVKKSKLIRSGGEVEIVECEGVDHDDCEISNIFPVHYIYDPAKNVEYFDWEVKDGLLNARDKDGVWVRYNSRGESLYAMHEYVGGCWFVFSGVSFSRRVININNQDKEASSAKEFVREFNSRSMIKGTENKYFLEGGVSISPGPGWMSLEVYAEAFHVEIPDSD